ncbi:hypothetical protein G6F54_013906 [Rhizopus delemar]|nr:hypothetical protein G6F54_013906 [Rhizopus delemar]
MVEPAGAGGQPRAGGDRHADGAPPARQAAATRPLRQVRPAVFRSAAAGKCIPRTGGRCASRGAEASRYPNAGCGHRGRPGR